MNAELREQCQHRWVDIYKNFGMSDVFVAKRHGPCPLCGGTDRCRMTDYQGYGGVICNQCCPESIDGIEMLIRHTGRGFKDIADDIRSMLGETTVKAEPVKNIERTRARLKQTWVDAKPLTPNCPTHLYLHGRGLAGLDYAAIENIRCHPGLTYWHRELDGAYTDMGKHPAMLGLVVNAKNEPLTIHCTYLTTSGQKADVKQQKKILPTTRDYKSCVVRLQALGKDDVLCVAEGIETALAMKVLYPDIVPWACLSAGNMEDFVPPFDYTGSTLYIAADNDISHTGQAAAYELAKRLCKKKIKASVLMPKKQGHDFLDQLNEQKQVSA